MHKLRPVTLALILSLSLAGCAGSPSASPTSPNASAGPAAAFPIEHVAVGGSLDVTLTAAETMVPHNGGTRWAMTYNGSVAGPTIRIHPGDRLRVTLVNNLNKPTSLHTHGLHVDPAVDDPFLMVEPGASHTYEYDIPADHQAGTYWYHPHVHELSAEQLASGLSGAIVVENATDDALRAATTDSVLVVNDPPLAQSNPWTAGGMGMMGQMMGRTGPMLLTNGHAGVELPESVGRLQRVHVVNATSSTRLRLTYSGEAMRVLSATGGRLAAPREATEVELAPGERTEAMLVPGPDGGTLSAQRMSNEGMGAATGDPEVIATVPADSGTSLAALPASLQADTRDLFAADVKVATVRTITLDGHMNPTIDGKLFDPARVDVEAMKGTVEEWRIVSTSPMYHPFHLHTWPMQRPGSTDWQDVVMVAPNETVVVRVAFEDYAGTTVLHCHILDHEDTGMMAVIGVS